ncbi:hypothetical protein HHL22_03495 [Hymenobacter sp. RP-2-7]|uniref:DUF4136 domain-containing protein n=1 Tax=Hymenobacter polaris TaxID=2682546 RepID=A0A7Y0ABK0_9BACT|nr:hypothetical protein [Hymenobacter polaris]NML64263.1 hypothetical protein [Hymenobacter polaris]
MIRRFSTADRLTGRVLALGAAGLAAALALGSCRHESVVVPAYSDYYPLTLGAYRSYVVQDSTWKAGKVTTTQYQLRERVSEQFSDAAGLPAYRLVRSRRADASAAWTDDSVLVVQPLPRALLLTRSNVRTVEMIYPPVAGKGWNQYALTVNGQAATYQFVDTVTNLTRRYGPSVGGAYTTPAAGPAAAKAYATTATVLDILPVGLNDGIYRRSGYQQVFALGTGPVLRRRYYYELFTTGSGGQQTPTSSIQNGTSRRETLLETGTL